MTLTRRTLLATGAATAVAALTAPRLARAAAPFAQPGLPFAEDALAPVISARTVGIHYGSHHRGYYDRLNELVAGTPYADLDVEGIVVATAGADAGTPDAAIFNQAAQAWNHVSYWDAFVPGGPNRPEGDAATAIDAAFGDYAGFVDAAVAAATTGVFGTGWAWLTRDDAGALALVPYEDGLNPLAVGRPALFGIDVWEHAYYLDYENGREAHVRAVLDQIVNWEVVGARMAAG